MHRKLLPCAAEVGKRAILPGNFEFNIALPFSGAARIHDMVGKLRLRASWLTSCGFSSPRPFNSPSVLHLFSSSSYFDAQRVVY